MGEAQRSRRADLWRLPAGRGCLEASRPKAPRGAGEPWGVKRGQLGHRGVEVGCQVQPQEGDPRLAHHTPQWHRIRLFEQLDSRRMVRGPWSLRVVGVPRDFSTALEFTSFRPRLGGPTFLETV